MEHHLRGGDLRVDFFGAARAVEGIRIHQQIQRSRPATYQAEIPISRNVETDHFVLCISGRIDGVFSREDRPIVEEIKSTRRPLDEITESPDPVHWGQARCYAYMWAVQEGVESMDVQLTYVHVPSGEIREMVRTYELEALTAFFEDLVDHYHRWLTTLVHWSALRERSIEQMEFPFTSYRPGQRDMAVAVYRCVRDGGHLLVQAATGIGKTMAALFPAIKAVGERLAAKIVFLTARTTGRLAAEAALDILRQNGLRLKSVSITAKDKICFAPESACLPEECPYAKGFYDRINAAVETAFQMDGLNRDAIETVARRHQVCPFELTLEMIQWADCVIGDYNYAFDPRVTLQRLFQEESGAKAILIDEAHNLVDRSRDMFSAELDKQTLLSFRRVVKNELPQLYQALGSINTLLVAERRRTREAGGSLVSMHPPGELVDRLQAFARLAENWLTKNIRTPFREDLLQLYFDCMRFIRVAETFDERYATIYQCTDEDLRIRQFCIDPSVQLETAWQQCKAAVLFSATLTPAGYFQNLLGCRPDTARLDLISPFPADNLAVLRACRISTFFQERKYSCGAVSRMIGAFVARNKGNYLVFFPSYAYLQMVLEQFETAFGHLEILAQTPEMVESDRIDFLDRFKAGKNESLVGFAVMGGVFGEGIDLKGDRLTGAVIVGVGLPGICPERELIRSYYDEHDGRGFAYAYQYPGINRVLQAAGRVIRSEHDRGAVLLIDQRYARSFYASLLPPHWRILNINGPDEIESALLGFWA